VQWIDPAVAACSTYSKRINVMQVDYMNYIKMSSWPSKP
jgi:hypothetical protein